MRFEQTLLEGALVRRRKRYLADIKLRDGQEITAHYLSAGGLSSMGEIGGRVLVSVNEDPRRRFNHQLEVIYSGRVAVGVHAGRPLPVVLDAMMHGKINELRGYARMRRDPRSLKSDNLDFMLEGNGLRPAFVAVRSVVTAKDKVCFYPDAPLPKGPAHLHAMTDLVREGNRAMLLFVAQRNDVETLKPQDDVDHDYGTALRDAAARGVEVLCYRARVGRRTIELERKIDVDLTD